MAARRLLGLDVGARRIGVAVSEGTIAVPLTIIEHVARADDLARIAEIVSREGAAGIVVGLPVSLDGEEHEQARLTRKFAEQLAKEVGVPVIYEDELLSTADAEAELRTGALRQRPQRRRGARPADDHAAAVILQRYLDAHPQAK